MADELDSDSEEHDIEFQRLKDTHGKTGYVEGLEAAQEEALQQGFNQGFAEASAVTMKFGNLRGAISALVSFLTMKGDPVSTEQVIKELLELEKKVQQESNEVLSVHKKDLKHKLDEASEVVTAEQTQNLKSCICREKTNNCCGNQTVRENKENTLGDAELQSCRELWKLFHGLAMNTELNIGEDELHTIMSLSHVSSR